MSLYFGEESINGDIYLENNNMHTASTNISVVVDNSSTGKRVCIPRL